MLAGVVTDVRKLPCNTPLLSFVQVRVSAGVVVQRDPVEYEYSNFTEWVTVSGIMIFREW